MEPNKELEQAIENKFLTPSKFAQEIENIVRKKRTSIILTQYVTIAKLIILR